MTPGRDGTESDETTVPVVGDVKQPGQEREQSSWVGERITLTWNDLQVPGGLTSTVHLPSRHVHPTVRAAGEEVMSAQAKADGLRQRVADRKSVGLQELMAELDGESDEEAAGRRLTDFESTTKVLERRISAADVAVREAWQGLAGSVHANAGAWNEYLYTAAAEALQTPLGTIWQLPEWLGELVLIDNLLAREGIIQPAGEAKPAAFKRSERTNSVEGILSGESRAGRQMGLLELVKEYEQALSKPVPVVEVKAEPEEPLAVRLQRECRNPPARSHL